MLDFNVHASKIDFLASSRFDFIVDSGFVGVEADVDAGEDGETVVEGVVCLVTRFTTIRYIIWDIKKDDIRKHLRN